ncbi:hypothetical protein POM88_012457 [Heracleum sosnowskyi]|uniref:Uncharacterized protein n=1 Tax=Heracleum sosnowskyi TaxID=360622 RepID=A0AAD8IZ35_9APIA|nr:hypothetical protein POM88_012457 [Heracleum sosnowskyi]
MVRAELIFIPSPGVGHLVSSIEVAKLIASRDEQISISILIMKMPFDTSRAAFTHNLKKDAPERITFADIPDLDETTRTELMSLPPMIFFTSFVESQRTLVRDTWQMNSMSQHMYSSLLVLLLKDNESQEVHEYKDSDFERSPPGFRNPVPVKVLPSLMLSKDGSAMVIVISRRLREANAILVNTVWELEAHAIYRGPC